MQKRDNSALFQGKYLLAVGLVLLIWLSVGQRVSAAIELEADEDGNITWVTSPTMATSGIKWRTQGFLVYARKTEYGHPLTSGEPYGRILVDDERVSVKTEYDQETGKYISTFTIDADYIKSVITSNKELYEQFQENVEAGEACIYFNNFFQSYRVNSDGSETILTSNMYDIETIRNNQGWANKKEWDSGYYNIPVSYRVTGNVHIKLVDSDGELLGIATGLTSPAGTAVYQITADGIPKKNPGLAFYKAKYAEMGLCESTEKAYVGDKVTIYLPLQVVAGGRTYELYRSYYYQNIGDSERQADTRLKNDREGTLRKEIRLGLISSRVVGRYREIDADAPEPGVEEAMEGAFTEAVPTGIIAADDPGNSRFDVAQGIPTMESLYTQVQTPEYLAGYQFTKRTGTRTYTARGTITWNLVWQEGEGEDAVIRSAVQTVTYAAPVERTYSYWEISQLEVYGLTEARICNGALPGGEQLLTPAGYQPPVVSMNHSSGPDAHVKQPEEIGQIHNLGVMTYYGTSPPAYDAGAMLDALVGECQVRNDSLIFAGEVIMDDSWSEKTTSRPATLETEPDETTPEMLRKCGLTIPAVLANGQYESSGDVCYKRIAAVNSTRPETIRIPIEDCNPVTVHTPVVCTPQIIGRKELCQLLTPTDGCIQLVLDTTFRVSLPTAGEHRYIRGYGLRNYRKYTAARQVRFPFEVYVGDSRLVPAGTWTDVTENTTFYLPVRVEEGVYQVEFRSVAVNACANDAMDRTGYQANDSPEEYVAVDTIPVEVSGRLYEFEVNDISDYPVWESVFRDADGGWNGFSYRLGELPLMSGSHPRYPNLGVLKTGYVFRYRLQTIGDYTGKEDDVRITPGFYYLSRDGTVRMEVDVYYSEYSGEPGRARELIKAGSPQSGALQPDRTEILSGRQSWQGEYYLPKEIHVCPKDFDLQNWCERFGVLDYREGFWLKDGYVMVSFDIETILDGERHLSYINAGNAAEGYCNMWALEGAIGTRTDYFGGVFQIKDGDVAMYDTDRSVDEDYRADVIYE